jgi:hypothetical protein
VDIGPAGTAVIDYKVGKPPSLAEVRNGRALQAVLYTHAVHEVLGKPVLLAVYRGLKDGIDLEIDPAASVGAKTNDLAGPDRTYLDVALSAAKTAAAGIRAGSIAADPSTAASCVYCPATDACPGRRP